MISAASVKTFPYNSKIICYIEVTPNGKINQINDSPPSVQKAYQNAINGKTTIYAVWPGHFRSNLVVIDNLDKFAEAFGIRHPKKSHS